MPDEDMPREIILFTEMEQSAKDKKQYTGVKI